MKVDYVEESSVRKALSFEVEPETVQAEIDSRARELARRVKLPGFRPGKVPVEVVKQRFKDEILGEAAEAIVNKVVFDELDGRGLKPLAPPRVEEVKLEEGQPMSFKAVFETLPLVELPDWKGLRVTAKGVNVSDEDVAKEVDRLREEAARYDALDEETKAEIEDMICEHSLMYSRGSLGFLDYSDEEKQMFKPVQQRLVRTHPVHGRKSLYLSSHAGAIKGMSMPEGRLLLRDLNEHATQSEFVYVHKWTLHDLVMWDNRQTMHRVRRYDQSQPRDMRRATVAGTAPTVAQQAAE